jgi:hypothetical protein
MAKYRAGGGFAREWGPVSLSLSATHLGPRPLQTDASSLSGVPHSKDEPVRTLLDAALTWRPLRPGMEVQFAIHNLGAEDYRLGQPYYGGHAPMPTGDREVTLGVRWRF